MPPVPTGRVRQEDTSRECRQCPLAGYAWRKRFLGCIQPDTDYMAWVHAVLTGNEEVASYYAIKIAYACKRALGGMEG